MTAHVLTPFNTQKNTLDAARQEYRLARKHYHEVCQRYDARFPESQEAFRAALERRQAAFDRYMREMQNQ